MKVTLDGSGLLVVPETEFETEVLTRMFKPGEEHKAFVKCGATPADVVGLRVGGKQSKGKGASGGEEDGDE